jgi:hypothetical protein
MALRMMISLSNRFRLIPPIIGDHSKMSHSMNLFIDAFIVACMHDVISQRRRGSRSEIPFNKGMAAFPSFRYPDEK